MTASFVIPENVRNGNHAVELTDSLYSARTRRPRSTTRWSSPASSALSRSASSLRAWCRWSGADGHRAQRPSGPDLQLHPGPG
ncbi:MAG: hypothetical protein MZV70_52275 [Desulfobacterales bacterium]|nr:hypothetical protein [Desulfobacterales bacterium]